MKSSELVFDCVHFTSYNCHKTNSNCGGSYIDSSGWIKNKYATINPIDKEDDKCFQYTVTVVLNHAVIKKHPQSIAKIKQFINRYKWEEINFPSRKDDWKKIAKIM